MQSQEVRHQARQGKVRHGQAVASFQRGLRTSAPHRACGSPSHRAARIGEKPGSTEGRDSKASGGSIGWGSREGRVLQEAGSRPGLSLAQVKFGHASVSK